MPKPHVVVIDDDPVARNSVSALLTAFNFTVESFASAEEFLACNDRPQHSCLLIDVQLPGMSGRDLQKTLNEMGDPSPLILISGYVEPSFVQEAVEDGAISVLEKPVAPNSLVAHLQRALGLDDQ